MVRKIIGTTIPEKAAPGTIRGDYSIDTVTAANLNKRPINNLIHASGNLEEAEYEVNLRFPELAA
jgi:nucleoside-diphosphate kinase